MDGRVHRRGQGAAGPEGEERGRVAAGGEVAGQQHGLAFGATAAEAVLKDEDFHCPRGRWTKSGGITDEYPVVSTTRELGGAGAGRDARDEDRAGHPVRRW